MNHHFQNSGVEKINDNKQSDQLLQDKYWRILTKYRLTCMTEKVFQNPNQEHYNFTTILNLITDQRT